MANAKARRSGNPAVRAAKHSRLLLPLDTRMMLKHASGPDERGFVRLWLTCRGCGAHAMVVDTPAGAYETACQAIDAHERRHR